ncbi:MAG TPA: TIGR04283 family arsenosugar biosynthesis glycosyltransferase [Xanthobacteraceae bacterium]|nr:TIGR04283 family arsenosugar biosynthesis glycosyltransferase [Xanthobacteraceae bacterium]
MSPWRGWNLYAAVEYAMTELSIIIPVLNEAASIRAALLRLQDLRVRGVEVLVVDGGSCDGTLEQVKDLADVAMTARRGRGVQMNAGAARARGNVLLFLHADTRLPDEADRLLRDGLARSKCAWGRFDIAIEGRSPLLPIVAAMMNLRSRVTGIATGDQAMFMTREAFARAGKFPEIPLMEDVAVSRRLKRISPPLGLKVRAVTSGRRWDERGALRTILLMWRLRLAYFCGAAPETLARRYGYVSCRS